MVEYINNLCLFLLLYRNLFQKYVIYKARWL